MSTKANLASTDPGERGLFETIKEDASEVLDLFTGVDQSDVADNRVDLSKLSREDRIELLVDGSTSSIFGSSPWSIGLGLDQSVSQEIHAQKGSTLVFAVEAGVLDAAEAALLTSRYVLVWDDTIVAEGPANLSVSPFGKTFLVVGVKDEPRGERLTLWITDNDLKVTLVKQSPLKDIEQVRKEVIGEIGAAADKDENPITAAFNTVSGFFTTSAVGGVVALSVVAVVLIVLIRSEAFKDVAATAVKVVK